MDFISETDKAYENKNKSEKVVEAYNSDGEKIWEISNIKMGTFENKYAVDKANKFYTVFNERDVNFQSAPLINSYLSCLSKKGTKVWEKTFDSEIQKGSLIIDYVGKSKSGKLISLGPMPSIGESNLPKTKYLPLYSWVFSTRNTSCVFSTTQS